MNVPDAYQRPLYVLGGEHSFSDEAAKSLLPKHPDLHIAYVNTIDDVWAGAEKGSGLGVVPLENSTGGVVWPHLDRLRTGPWQIVGQVMQRVHMCAGGNPGSSLGTARRVLSHPKAIEQCEGYLRGLPMLKDRDGSAASTVAAARTLASNPDDRDTIVLASKSALTDPTIGLELWETGVSDAERSGRTNITQCLIVRHRSEISQALRPNPAARYHAAVLEPRNEIGALEKLLASIRMAKLDLLSLQSRILDMTPDGKKTYDFFIEMDGADSTPALFSAMTDQWRKAEREDRLRVQWLGSWTNGEALALD